ncbi:glycylpeptide N-tetradecanoyltransferase, putative, partial [Eimeria maxima]
MPKDCCSKEEEARQQPKSRGEETPATASSASVPDNAERNSKPEAAEAAAAVAETAAKGQQIKANSMASAASLVQAIRGSASCLLSIPPPVLSPSIPLGAAEANLCSCVSQDEGPIDATKTVEDVKKEPYNLPNGFVWSECSVEDPQVLDEVGATPGVRIFSRLAKDSDVALLSLYNLLALHYVEDDDNLFRFNYGKDFLVWALNPPNFFKEWIIGVRVEASQKDSSPPSPQLSCATLKESELQKSIFSAYTRNFEASVSLRIGFFLKVIPEVNDLRVTLQCCSTVRLSGIRHFIVGALQPKWVQLGRICRQFKLYPDFTIEEVQHWLMPKDGVVHVYVREQEGKVTDLISFYELPSSVIGNQKHKEVKAAYSFYNVATSVPLKELIQDALCLAKQKDFDVFNALDVMENKTFVEELKFGVGDGFLRYYLYNWRCPQ